METEIKKQVETLKKALEKKETAQEYIVKTRTGLKDYKSDVNAEIISKIIPLGISLCCLSSLLAINACFSKILRFTTTYDTTVNTFDTISGYSISEEERECIKSGEETLLIEYEPWQKYGDHYTRDYIEYDVSSIKYSDLAQYLLLDLEQFNINGNQKTEEKDELESQDLYEGVKYSVVNSIQDKFSKHTRETPEDSEKLVNFTKIMLILTFASTIPIAISFSLSSKYSFENLRSRKKEIEIDMKNLLERYREVNRDITKINNELINLYAKYGNLLEDSKNESNKLIRGK